jgi:GAF domain-containing protein
MTGAGPEGIRPGVHPKGTWRHEGEVVSALRRSLQRLTPGDLDATLLSIARAAVEALPQVHYAGITLRRRDGTLVSCAMTDILLADLDEQQHRLQEGPCHDAVATASFVVSDVGLDERYPNYGPVAVAGGIRSQAAVRLFESKQTVGVLNLYSREAGALDGVAMVSRLFADQAAIALAYSIEITTLREAVQTRARIGQAVGLVMERYKLPERQAFAFLTRMSQTRNVKLRHIADQMIGADAGAWASAGTCEPVVEG